jgi:hypothetical protein
MAALFVDENELEKFRQSVFSDSTRLHYGLLVGMTVQAKSELKTTLIAFTSTPCDEAQYPKAFRDFDLERLSAHAREASRYLVGGIHVVGFYTVGPAADVDNGAIHTTFKYLNSSSDMFLTTDGAERARDKFHLHFDTVKKSAPPKVQMFSLSKAGAMTLQPIMLKAQDVRKDRELVVLHCRFALSCAINSLRPAALTAIKTCIDGCYPSVADAPKASQAKDLLGKEIHFFSSSCLSDNDSGTLLVRGTVAATACVCSNAPCKDVFDALKQDAYASLRSRLERLHVETDNSKNLDASKQQSLGRRFIVPAFASGCCISDCVTRDETIKSSLSSLSDVFPSSIANDACVSFIEDEELDLQIGQPQHAYASAAATQPSAAKGTDSSNKPNYNLNLIIIAVVFLAVVVKFFL